jgi:quercetin dioxygenase-like cupin family protein
MTKEIIMTNQSNPEKGTAFNLEQYVDYASGSVVSKTLLKKEIGNITLFAFDKGQGLSEHTAPFDAVVHILDGEAEITIGGQTQTVAAGEMLIMPANISHALQAETPFKMLLVMIRSE